jgi:hypothetical protein
MEAFMNPEVIAGVILAFYFFARAATSLIDRRNGTPTNGNGKVAAAKHDLLVETDLTSLRQEVKELRAIVERWDDQIQAGQFTCKWTEREVVQIADKIDLILSDGPWTTALDRNYERIREIQRQLSDLNMKLKDH